MLFCRNSTVNRYDLIIIATIASLAYGNFELLGALWPIRIIGFLALPFLIKHGITLYKSVFRPWIFLFGLWWGFMIISLFWTPNLPLGIAYSFHLTAMMSCFFLLFLCTLKASFPLLAFINGWILFLLITLPIALWEIITGNHLPSGSFNAGSVMNGEYRLFAAVTFMNFNSFVLMLCLALPFINLVFISDLKRKHGLGIICFILLILSSFILIINASRVGIVCLSLSYFLLFLSLFNGANKSTKVALLFLLGVIVVLLVQNMEQIALFHQITERLNGKNSFVEDDARTDLIGGAIKIATDTFLFGGGIMSMNTLFKNHTTCSILFAHNFVLELLIEYGFIITLCFFYFFYKFLFRIKKVTNRLSNFLFWYAILSSIFLFVIDDCYQSRAGIWIYMASLISIAGVKGCLLQTRTQ